MRSRFPWGAGRIAERRGENVYPLKIDATVLAALKAVRIKTKFADLPGYDTAEEQARCSRRVNDLLDLLIGGIEQSPRKSWVLEQFLPTLEAACEEDTEARERFGPYLEQILDILGIESSDGMLNFYPAFGGVA